MTCNCNRDGDIEYTITLNAQGPQGPAGAEGQAGFSPVIGVYSNTEANYQLQIITADGEIITPNLKANVNTNDFVTINGDENITGVKTFLSPTYFNDGLYINYPAGGNSYTILNQNANGFNIDAGASKDVSVIGKLLSLTTKGDPNTIRPVLTDNNIIEGEGIDIIRDGEGNVTVNSIAPDNMVTIDTTQTITGNKTFTKDFHIIKEATSGSNKSQGDLFLKLDVTPNESGFRTTYSGGITITDYQNNIPTASRTDNIVFQSFLPTLLQPYAKTDNVVTLTTEQTVTGPKTFSAPTIFNDIVTIGYPNDTNYSMTLASDRDACYIEPSMFRDLNVSGKLFCRPISKGEEALSPVVTVSNLIEGNGVTLSKDDKGNVTISATGGGTGTTSNNGIKGDYATNYGIIDCQNGLVTTSATSLDVEITGGLVMKLAGNPLKTTNGSTFTYTVQETDGVITLFYTEGGTIIEAGDVFYQTTEPTNGTMSFAAWYNPELESGKWQFKSNDTGNVWREASATPIVNLTIANGVITNADYTGYRVLDDEIFALKNETIQTVTTPLKKEGNALSLNIDNQTIQVNTQGQLTANLDELGNEVNSLSGRVTTLEGSIGNNSIQRLTATQYAGLTTKNPNTLYVVVADDNSNFTMYVGEIPLFMPSGGGGDNFSQKSYISKVDVNANAEQA